MRLFQVGSCQAAISDWQRQAVTASQQQAVTAPQTHPHTALHPHTHPVCLPALPVSPACRRQALLSSVDVLPSLEGLVATGGRLNVARAMGHLLAGNRPVNSLLCEPAPPLLGPA